MKSKNKKIPQRNNKSRKKCHPITAKDIFILNSFSSSNNIDSYINEVLSKELGNCNKLNFVFNEYFISFLPYVIYWIIKINEIEYCLPLNNCISVDVISGFESKYNKKSGNLHKFSDLLRFENMFKESIVNYNSKEDIKNLRILNNEFFENIDMFCNTNLKFDLYLELPESIFQQNDHLNYLYFIKRGVFVYKLYVELEKLIGMTPNFENDVLNSQIVSLIENIFKLSEYKGVTKNLIENSIKNIGSYDKINLEIDYSYGLTYLPIIIITFMLQNSNGELNSENRNSFSVTPKCITFRIHTVSPKNETLIDVNNVSVFRNSVTESITNSESWTCPPNLNHLLLPPTPQYNGAILNELNEFYKENGYKKKIQNTILNNKLLLNTFRLLKVWCIKIGIWDNIYINRKNNMNCVLRNDVDGISKFEEYHSIGQLNSEVIMCFLFHSYLLNKTVVDDNLVSPFNLFKIVLTNVRNMITRWRETLNLEDDNGENTGIHYVIGRSEPESFKRVFLRGSDYLKEKKSLNLYNRDLICKQVFIFFNEQKSHNILWRCQDLVKNELEDIITSTLSFIENKNMLNYSDNILKLFSLEKNETCFTDYRNISLLDYDSCFIITSYRGNTIKGIKLRLGHTIPGDYNVKKLCLKRFYDSNSDIINEKYSFERDFNSIWENNRSTNLVDAIRNLLCRCFSDRLNKISLKEIISSDGSFGCIIGLKFDQSVTKYLIKGPSVNTKESKIFKEFWGNKVDTRRFKDGTVLETVLWDSKSKLKEGFMSNMSVNFEIIDYVLNKYLPIIHYDHNEKTLKNSGDNLVFYSLNTPFGYILPYNKNERCIIEEFENFKKKIMNLKSMPLKIKSLTSSSSTLRFMEYYNCINSCEKSNLHEISNSENCNYNGTTTEISCVIELEQSSNWPKTKDSINRIKTAFLLQIKQELSESHFINSDIIPNDDFYDGCYLRDLYEESNIFIGVNDQYGLKPFLDVYWTQHLTFRVSIFHSNEFLNIANKILDLDNISNDIIKKNINMDENELKDINQIRDLWWSVQVSSKLSNLSNCFPSFRGTVRKLKEFASNMKIPNSEEFIDHIVSYVYTSNDFINNFHGFITSPTCGFIRSLVLISGYNWEKKPLIVDLEYQVDENGFETRISNEDYEKLDKIHTFYYNFTNKHNKERKPFYVSSLIDPQSLFIKVPNNYNSLRFVHLSKMFLNIIIESQFYLPIDKVNELILFNNPKCDIIITLNENYEKIIRPKSINLSSKMNLTLSCSGLRNQYVNLNTTENLLKKINLKSNPLTISRELFQTFILDIQKYFDYKVVLMYDSYTIPYPKHVYVKVFSDIVRTSITKSKVGTYSECILGLNDQHKDTDLNQGYLALPNILEVISNLSRSYRELISNIKLV
ncbi:hypothetical protein FG386_001253 [Cryptosporidium ryanae]|uniref:uncharacterized protein n=1 Tax=Cryptosporidium ryanae TaxID=515981 RepID=UPI003519EF02|nr:hypothetical protein FG386_001253 [Cryptosporidium ryanae]